MEAEFKKIDVNGGGIILFDEHLGRLSYSILLAFVLPIFPDLVMTYFFPDSTVRHFPMYPSAAAYSVLRSAYGLKMQSLQSLIVSVVLGRVLWSLQSLCALLYRGIWHIMYSNYTNCFAQIRFCRYFTDRECPEAMQDSL